MIEVPWDEKSLGWSAPGDGPRLGPGEGAESVGASGRPRVPPGVACARTGGASQRIATTIFESLRIVLITPSWPFASATRLFAISHHRHRILEAWKWRVFPGPTLP
jgi:hypothetical protein